LVWVLLTYGGEAPKPQRGLSPKGLDAFGIECDIKDELRFISMPEASRLAFVVRNEYNTSCVSRMYYICCLAALIGVAYPLQ
jgi:hypothetical protein